MNTLNTILKTVFHQECLQNTSYKVYTKIPTKCIENTYIDNTIDLLFTKDDQICGYIKMIRPRLFHKTENIIEKSVMDRDISSSDFKELIKNSYFSKIPFYLDLPTTVSYTNDISDFTNHVIASNPTNITIKYLDKKDIKKEFPDLEFEKFLLEQHLINKKNNITAFGQEYGLVKQYCIHPITKKLVYKFVILATYYPKFLKIIQLANPQILPLQDRIEQNTLYNPFNLSKLDQVYTLSSQLLLTNLFENNLEDLERLQTIVSIYSGPKPIRYGDIAQRIHDMYQRPLYRKHAIKALDLLVSVLPDNLTNE